MKSYADHVRKLVPETNEMLCKSYKRFLKYAAVSLRVAPRLCADCISALLLCQALGGCERR
jgi:hypothetical protein